MKPFYHFLLLARSQLAAQLTRTQQHRRITFVFTSPSHGPIQLLDTDTASSTYSERTEITRHAHLTKLHTPFGAKRCDPIVYKIKNIRQQPPWRPGTQVSSKRRPRKSPPSARTSSQANKTATLKTIPTYAVSSVDTMSKRAVPFHHGCLRTPRRQLNKPSSLS